MCLFGGDLVPRVRDLPRVALLITAPGLVAALANHAWGTDFWFLGTAAPGSPLEPIQSMSGSAYVPVLIGLFAALVAVLYLPWVVAARKRAEPVGDLVTVPAQPVATPER